MVGTPYPKERKKSPNKPRGVSLIMTCYTVERRRWNAYAKIEDCYLESPEKGWDAAVAESKARAEAEQKREDRANYLIERAEYEVLIESDFRKFKWNEELFLLKDEAGYRPLKI